MIGFLVLVVLLGVICYLINTYVPMAPIFKAVFNIVIALFLIIYLLNLFGFDTGLHFNRIERGHGRISG